jgi:cell division protein FtsW
MSLFSATTGNFFMQESKRNAPSPVDLPLLLSAITLLGLGLVMIASASIGIAERQVGDPFYYLLRQGLFAAMGVALAFAAAQVPLKVWQTIGPLLLMLSGILLVALFIPGVGRSVNGSTRWLMLGPFNLQPSEMVKLTFIIYLAGYLVRRSEAVRNTVSGFLMPMSLVGIFAVLMLLQPDFGASAVVMATALGMMFLGGIRLWLFGLLLAMAASALALLAISSPYRMERLTTFLNPWADPFNSGFQLTQSLIAFGRGEWQGVGLGSSVQKLFYLPEAHTDFVYAVLAEELGLIGAALVVVLFGVLIWRIFRIGKCSAESGNDFGSYLSYGIGLWLAMQAFINMGVNMGLLPTKGLTLPLMSYGGSSMIITWIAIALVLRVGYETGGVPGRNRRGLS